MDPCHKPNTVKLGKIRAGTPVADKLNVVFQWHFPTMPWARQLFAPHEKLDAGSVLVCTDQFWIRLRIASASTMWTQKRFWQNHSCQNRFRIALSVDTACNLLLNDQKLSWLDLMSYPWGSFINIGPYLCESCPEVIRVHWTIGMIGKVSLHSDSIGNFCQSITVTKKSLGKRQKWNGYTNVEPSPEAVFTHDLEEHPHYSATLRAEWWTLHGILTQSLDLLPMGRQERCVWVKSKVTNVSTWWTTLSREKLLKVSGPCQGESISIRTGSEELLSSDVMTGCTLSSRWTSFWKATHKLLESETERAV